MPELPTDDPEEVLHLSRFLPRVDAPAPRARIRSPSRRRDAVLEVCPAGRGDGAGRLRPAPARLRQVVAQGERRGLKPLDAVITGPTILPDGSPLVAPRYDPATRLLFDPLGDPVPEVPSNPTPKQAQRALDTLLLPFEAVPFVDALAHVLEHRMEMLAAACVLIRARFTHAGRLAEGRLAPF